MSFENTNHTNLTKDYNGNVGSRHGATEWTETSRRIRDSLSKNDLRVFRASCVMLCYLSYFSNSEFFDLNSGTVRFISFTISGMFTSRLSFSSSFDAFKAS